MRILNEIFRNYMLVSAAVSWLAAQIIKTCIDAYFNKEFHWERMVGSGGMPSSHSSFVCALTAAAAWQYGLDSPFFAIAFTLSAVVMYDATGVRRETGKQAVILNKLILENPFQWEGEEFEKKLKEYVGHTPLQVLMGAILGVIVAYCVKFRYF